MSVLSYALKERIKDEKCEGHRGKRPGAMQWKRCRAG
jgi:hypothetical protein